MSRHWEKYYEIWAPFLSMLSQDQLHTVLLAILPLWLEKYRTNIYVIDIVFTNALAFLLASAVFSIGQIVEDIFSSSTIGFLKPLSITIDHITLDVYDRPSVNEHHKALSWLISTCTKELEKGAFRSRYDATSNILNSKARSDEIEPSEFLVLPCNFQGIDIARQGIKYNLCFIEKPRERERDANQTSSVNSNGQVIIRPKHNEPAILIKYSKWQSQRVKAKSVAALYAFVLEVTKEYLDMEKKDEIRKRWEWIDDYWSPIQSIHIHRTWDSLALDHDMEQLLKHDVESFLESKVFHHRIGLPFRRGYLLSGKPGTGKTSFVNVLSSVYHRDIYQLNLQSCKSDSDLSAAFTEVEPNSIILLEDVDTMSEAIHERSQKAQACQSGDLLSSALLASAAAATPGAFRSSGFTLSTFLGCLDGHQLQDGIIIVMTTNHPEVLDSAVRRPGRVEHFEFRYCTRYMIQKMYQSVMEVKPQVSSDDKKGFDDVSGSHASGLSSDFLETIPEGVLPPAAVMSTLVLWKDHPHEIPQRLTDLLAQYQSGVSLPMKKSLMEKFRIRR